MTERQSKKYRPETVEELLTRLEQDPAYIAMRTADRQTRAPLLAAAYQAEEPIRAELARRGLVVDGISDLFNKGYDYVEFMPLLLEWLPRVSNEDIKGALVRALIDKRAPREVGAVLAQEFRKVTRGSSLEWEIGYALAYHAHEGLVNDLVEFGLDTSHVRGRDQIAMGLKKLKSPAAFDALIKMLTDPDWDVRVWTVMALRKKSLAKARPFVERLLDDPNERVRKQVAKTLQKYDSWAVAEGQSRNRPKSSRREMH